MHYKLLHIFRNTPLGRETFLQSLYFCKTIGALPSIYIPKSDKCLLYFSNDAVQLDLDSSYLSHPESAKKRAKALFAEAGFQPSFYEPENYTASTLPDISTNFDYLCCPRSVSDVSSQKSIVHLSHFGHLGHLGPRVRRIIKHATFPVLISSPVYKPWHSISVFFGGSQNAVTAFRTGIKIAMSSGLPLNMYTLREGKQKETYKKIIQAEGLDEVLSQYVKEWTFYSKKQLDQMLYDVPHDSLIVVGAYGHGVIKDILLGSKMEKIQTTLMNNLLITGPNCGIRLR